MHKRFDYFALPVKLMPAKCGELVMMSPKVGPSAGMKFSTPENTWNKFTVSVQSEL